MSIYFSNNQTQKILHLYKGSQAEEKNVFSGTSFHSSLPYLKLKSVHRFTYNGTTTNSNSGYVAQTRCYYTSPTAIPSDKKYDLFIVGYKDGIRYFFPTSFGEGYFSPNAFYYGSTLGHCPAFSLNGYSSGFTSTTSVPSNGIVPFSITLYDYIDIYVIDNLFSSIISSDIYIDRHDIKVNNNSIFSNVYLHFMTNISEGMNDYDTIIAIPHGSPSVGGFASQISYATSSDNITFSSSDSSGGFTLVQLINSYNHPISSVSLNGSDSSISCIKNNNYVKSFSSSISLKLTPYIYNRFVLFNQGQTIPNGLFLSKQIDSDSNSIVFIDITFSNPNFGTIENISSKIVASSQKTFIIYSSYTVTLYATISGSNVINFYGYNKNGYMQASCIFYCTLTVLK